jgi:hypothetical protein
LTSAFYPLASRGVPPEIRYSHCAGDLAIGATACIAFWRDLSFKAAAVSAASIFLLGDAVGHVKQMLIAGNFAPGNAGVPFYMDITCPVLSFAFLVIAKRQSAVQKS